MKKIKWLLFSITSLLFAILICVKISWEIDMKYWMPMLLVFLMFGNVSFNQFLES